jgi:probable phosphoglycerate mutase
MNPTAIISSDLGRAYETAQALSKLVGLTVSKHEDLRETNGGLWEGKTGSENRAEDFQNFIRWIDGDDNPAGTTGERRSEVAARAVGVINKALEGKSDQLLVVATHGGTARCVLGELLQLPLTHWGVIGGLSNASWSILERNPRQWNLIEHNAGSIPEPVYGEESGATPA